METFNDSAMLVRSIPTSRQYKTKLSYINGNIKVETFIYKFWWVYKKAMDPV